MPCWVGNSQQQRHSHTNWCQSLHLRGPHTAFCTPRNHSDRSQAHLWHIVCGRLQNHCDTPQPNWKHHSSWTLWLCQNQTHPLLTVNNACRCLCWIVLLDLVFIAIIFLLFCRTVSASKRGHQGCQLNSCDHAPAGVDLPWFICSFLVDFAWHFLSLLYQFSLFRTSCLSLGHGRMWTFAWYFMFCTFSFKFMVVPSYSLSLSVSISCSDGHWFNGVHPSWCQCACGLQCTSCRRAQHTREVLAVDNTNLDCVVLDVMCFGSTCLDALSSFMYIDVKFMTAIKK